MVLTELLPPISFAPLRLFVRVLSALSGAVLSRAVYSPAVVLTELHPPMFCVPWLCKLEWVLSALSGAVLSRAVHSPAVVLAELHPPQVWWLW